MSGFVVCGKCGKSFQPLKTPDGEIVRRAAKAKNTEFTVECPHCGKYLRVNPVAVVAGEEGTLEDRPTFRCPVSSCTGWVDYIESDEDDGPFWGCGECGSLWYKPAKLFKEIDGIVKKYPYRRKCYRQVKGKWTPVDPDEIPDEYEELVADEPEDNSNDYVRG